LIKSTEYKNSFDKFDPTDEQYEAVLKSLYPQEQCHTQGVHKFISLDSSLNSSFVGSNNSSFVSNGSSLSNYGANIIKSRNNRE